VIIAPRPSQSGRRQPIFMPTNADSASEVSRPQFQIKSVIKNKKEVADPQFDRTLVIHQREANIPP
jgi:hypothetical protein